MANRMIEWNLNYIASGQLCTNVTHWLGDTAETNLWLVAKTFLAALETPATGTSIIEEIMEIMSIDAFASSSTVRVMEPTPGTKAIKVYAVGEFPGGVADPIFAQSVAGVMKSVTASGPDYTGRTFFPAVPVASIANGRFTSAYRTLFNGVMSAFAAGIDSDGDLFSQVIYKRSNHTYEAVTNRQLNPNPGTIRKRLVPV